MDKTHKVTTTTTMLDIKRNGRVYPEETSETLRPDLKPEVAYQTNVSSRASSRLSIMSEKQELRELLQVGSGKKQRQTFQMIMMVVIPILGLLSITTVTLISTLQTFTKANKAQDQLRAMLQVRNVLCCISSNASTDFADGGGGGQAKRRAFTNY